jgi:superfamily II DNA helicase RecQ
MIDSTSRITRPLQQKHSNHHGCSVQATLDAAVAGRLKVLYVTPECLATSWVQSRLSAIAVSLVCIDEAHYASVTSANCRPGYLRLTKLISHLAPMATRYVVFIFARCCSLNREDAKGVVATEDLLIDNIYFRSNILDYC